MEIRGEFQSVCWTCSSVYDSGSFDDVNGFFETHLEWGHDVEMVNVELYEPLPAP